MKTAIQELLENFGHLLPDLESEYLEKEKQQIIEAYIEGYSAPENRGDSELYYTSTYTTNKETLK